MIKQLLAGGVSRIRPIVASARDINTAVHFAQQRFGRTIFDPCLTFLPTQSLEEEFHKYKVALILTSPFYIHGKLCPRCPQGTYFQ